MLTVIPYEEFALRADALRAQIAAACASIRSRPARPCELLAVTKTHPAAAADYAARYGLRRRRRKSRARGHWKNGRKSPRPRAALQLGTHRSPPVQQSRKPRRAALRPHPERRQRETSQPPRPCRRRISAKSLPVLLQINAGDDPAKFGADLADAPQASSKSRSRRKTLRVDGLMTIAPSRHHARLSTEHHAQTHFRQPPHVLRDDLAARIRRAACRELSMGMTGDLEPPPSPPAARMVRVGTALYGAR